MGDDAAFRRAFFGVRFALEGLSVEAQLGLIAGLAGELIAAVEAERRPVVQGLLVAMVGEAVASNLIGEPRGSA